GARARALSRRTDQSEARLRSQHLRAAWEGQSDPGRCQQSMPQQQEFGPACCYHRRSFFAPTPSYGLRASLSVALLSHNLSESPVVILAKLGSTISAYFGLGILEEEISESFSA